MEASQAYRPLSIAPDPDGTQDPGQAVLAAEDPALEFAHGVMAQSFLTLFESLGGVVLELTEQVVSGECGPVATGGIFELFDRDSHRVQRLEGGPQLIEVPLLRESF